MPTTWLSIAVLVVAGLIATASVALSFGSALGRDARARLRNVLNRIMIFLLFAPLLWLFTQLHGLLADVQTSIDLSPNEPIKTLANHAADVANTDHVVRPLVIVVALAGMCVQLLALPRSGRGGQGNAA